MPLNIDKYTDQIKNEETENKKYKKICLHILVSIVTVIIVLLVSFIVFYITNSPKNESELNEAKIIYKFMAINTDGLIDYCSTTDYLPKEYMNMFNKRLQNTVNYSDKIILKYTNIGEFKQQIRGKSIEYIEQDFQNIKKNYPSITKTDYCKMYDYKPKELVEYKIKNFKKYHANLLKD